MPLCLVIGLTFYVIWTWLLIPPDPDAFPGYESAVLLLVTAVLIEMIAEPLFIYAQIRCQFTIRIIAETSGLLVRCVLLLTFVIFSSGDNDSSGDISANGSSSSSSNNKSILLAFAVSQVLGSICYSLIFGIHFAKQPDCDLHEFVPALRAVSHWQSNPSLLLLISPSFPILFSLFFPFHCYFLCLCFSPVFLCV